MKGKKVRTVFLLTICCIFLIAAIVLAVHAGQSEGYKKWLNVLCSALFFILSLLIFVYWLISRKEDPNFFLYDRRTMQNIPLEKLTQEMVIQRMTYFVSRLAESPEMLWSGNVLEWNGQFGHRGVYKPLVAYKMLYDLGVQDDNSPYWNYLENASDESLGILCASLERAGETKIVRAFRLIMEKEPKPGPQIKDFLQKNVPYISSKMLAYVRRYIDCFY